VAVYEAPHALSRHEADARVEVAKAAESVLSARPPGHCRAWSSARPAARRRRSLGPL